MIKQFYFKANDHYHLLEQTAHWVAILCNDKAIYAKECESVDDASEFFEHLKNNMDDIINERM
ncbi:hypothetical protein [Paucilactobacillus sp. N302-9]